MSFINLTSSADSSKRASITHDIIDVPDSETEIIPRSVHALVDKKTKEFINKVCLYFHRLYGFLRELFLGKYISIFGRKIRFLRRVYKNKHYERQND